MFGRLDVFNAFLTCDIFNLSWFYWDITPSKLRKTSTVDKSIKIYKHASSIITAALGIWYCTCILSTQSSCERGVGENV